MTVPMEVQQPNLLVRTPDAKVRSEGRTRHPDEEEEGGIGHFPTTIKRLS